MNPFQQQGPPQLIQGVPIEAQAIVSQPEAIKMLHGVNGFELIMLYYFQMPFMMQQKHTQRIQKSSKNLLKYFGMSLVAGTFLNVQIKKLYMNFLKWPIYARIPIRLGIMGIPFVAAGSLIAQKADDLMGVMLQIQEKKQKLVATRNLYDYFDIQDPNRNKKKK